MNGDAVPKADLVRSRRLARASPADCPANAVQRPAGAFRTIVLQSQTRRYGLADLIQMEGSSIDGQQ